MDVTAKPAEEQEERGEHSLKWRMAVERITEPLPSEVQPPHFDLSNERRLSVTERGLAVLAAIEVVHEAVVGRLAEGAADADLR